MVSPTTRQRGGIGRASVAASALVAAGVCLNAADVTKLPSAWFAEAPAIDGSLTEWDGQLTRLGDSRLSVGVRNDGTFLYVALATSDPGTRLLLGRAGFTLWWDVRGRTAKETGLIVPSSMAAPDPRQRPAGRPGDWGGRDQPPPRQPPPSEPSPGDPGQGETPRGRPGETGGQRRGGPPAGMLPVTQLGHLILIGPRHDDQRRLEMTYLEKFGVAAAVAAREGVLSYEIRVPLVRGGDERPYAVGVQGPASVSLGIFSGELKAERPEGGGQGGRGGPGGGGPGGAGPGMGGFGGHGGMGRGGPGGPGFERPAPVKDWLLVELSGPPAP